MATFLFVDVHSGWCQQQYLYSPTAVAAESSTQSNDGILVQEVVIQRGDTLYKISRRFSGHGFYYPQILLFNDIKDPNKIYPGNVFKVPVARNRIPRPADKTPLKSASKGDKTVRGVKTQKSVVAAPSGAQVTPKNQRAALAADATTGAFEQAVKAYRRDDCRAALDLFDLFLAKNQSSALAADASLYKADCYLRLSNQK